MRHVLTICGAAALLAGCGALPLSVSQGQGDRAGTSEQSFRLVIAPRAARRGIYIASFNDREVLGLGITAKRHERQRCKLEVGLVTDIAVDPSGNLIVPVGDLNQSTSGLVTVYRGPDLCGPEAGSFTDPFGFPVNAVSLNALTGTIAVANENKEVNGKGGTIAICSLKAGCKRELSGGPDIGKLYGTAMAGNGDCWLTSAVPQYYSYLGYSPVMTYWKGCRGTGTVVTGYQNVNAGSISIDSHGNLVALDPEYYYSAQLWVYQGCNPDCKFVGGPFPINGETEFGAVNVKGDEYGAIEEYDPKIVDIYGYSPTKVTYKYSLPVDFGSFPTGFAFSPGLKP